MGYREGAEKDQFGDVQMTFLCKHGHLDFPIVKGLCISCASRIEGMRSHGSAVYREFGRTFPRIDTEE